MFFSYYGSVNVKKTGILSIPLPFNIPNGINGYRIFTEILQQDNTYVASLANSAFNDRRLSITFKKTGEQNFYLSAVAPII